MMDDFGFEAVRQDQIVVGEDISLLSVDELESRITMLNSEIVRIKEGISAKEGSKQAAEAFFKS